MKCCETSAAGVHCEVAASIPTVCHVSAAYDSEVAAEVPTVCCELSAACADEVHSEVASNIPTVCCEFSTAEPCNVDERIDSAPVLIETVASIPAECCETSDGADTPCTVESQHEELVTQEADQFALPRMIETSYHGLARLQHACKTATHRIRCSLRWLSSHTTDAVARVSQDDINQRGARWNSLPDPGADRTNPIKQCHIVVRGHSASKTSPWFANCCQCPGTGRAVSSIAGADELLSWQHYRRRASVSCDNASDIETASSQGLIGYDERQCRKRLLTFGCHPDNLLANQWAGLNKLVKANSENKLLWGNVVWACRAQQHYVERYNKRSRYKCCLVVNDVMMFKYDCDGREMRSKSGCQVRMVWARKRKKRWKNESCADVIVWLCYRLWICGCYRCVIVVKMAELLQRDAYWTVESFELVVMLISWTTVTQ